MKIIDCLGKFAKNALSVIPYIISFLVPRDERIWVFGCWFGRRYADNSRYVYEYVCANEPDIRAVWLSRDRKIVESLRRSGREAYTAGSILGYWICCRAGLAFVNCGMLDLNRIGPYRAKKVQLWHGTPLKKIKADDLITENSNGSNLHRLLRWVWSIVFPFSVERWDAIISSSDCVSERLISAFETDLAHVKVTGYPRGDVILASNPEPNIAIEAAMQKWNADKAICYLPTHRGEGTAKFDLFSGIDVRALEDCLTRHNALLFVKMHYYHAKSSSLVNLDKEKSRIVWLSEEDLPDVNFALPHVDLLITDYSSVYFDYLLLDRPMIFAPFDKIRYQNSDREFYEEYDSATPGPKCMSWQELICAIDETFIGDDSFKEMRHDLQYKYNTFVDTSNSRRVVELSKALLSGE